MRLSRAALVIIIAGVAAYAVYGIIEGDRVYTPEPIFHARLADASMYDNEGIYQTSASAKAGQYELHFVPNGDSPRMLTISIVGSGTSFEETFTLKSTPQGSESATYYTWDYTGQRVLNVGADSELSISIDPHGNLQGPVSVTLVVK